MSLTEIAYGSLASSEVMNNNFNYLDNKISDINENIIALSSSNDSNIANINISIQSTTENLNSLKNNFNNLSESLNQTNNSSLKMPNYNAGIEIGSGGVAPSNGFVWYHGEIIAVHNCWGNINGTKIITGDGQFGYWLDSNSIMCPVSQGDVFDYYGFKCIFFPMKGVV